MDEAEGVLQDDDDGSDTDDVIAEMCDKVKARLSVSKVPSKFAKFPKRFRNVTRIFLERSTNVPRMFTEHSLDVP
jgi:hypothetical protein